MKKIAILGATGHIAKGLILGLSSGKYELYLFARTLERVVDFAQSNCHDKKVAIMPFGQFYEIDYDVIINCVGIGDPSKLQSSGSEIFSITEEYDSLVLQYLTMHPSVLYINLSSGAAYGGIFTIPADDSTFARLNINHINSNDYYGIAKLYIEAKHRAMVKYNIVDLRIFGYFSQFINLSTKYFICEIISCLQESKEFITSSKNIIRDYVHPKDLTCLVERCIEKHVMNDVYDVYSLSPVTKFEILNYFTAAHNLKYVIDESIVIKTATGDKDNYYSMSRRAETIGYIPQFNSLECIDKETCKIINEFTKVN